MLAEPEVNSEEAVFNCTLPESADVLAPEMSELVPPVCAVLAPAVRTKDAPASLPFEPSSIVRGAADNSVEEPETSRILFESNPWFVVPVATEIEPD